MKISSAYPSKYLRAADLQDRQHTLIMGDVRMEDVGDDDHKPVLYFQNASKGLVLNKTNSRTISETYGDDTEAWAGRKLILFPMLVDFKGKMGPAVRVRVPQTPAAVPPAAAKPVLQHVDPEPPPHDGVTLGADMDDEIPF